MKTPKLPFNVPIISFLGRYWLLIALLVVFAFVAKNQAAFGIFSMVVWLPVLAIGAFLATLLIRNVLFRQSLDEDVRTGMFNKWYDELSPAEKVRWILGITTAIFWVIGNIAAALLSFTR